MIKTAKKKKIFTKINIQIAGGPAIYIMALLDETTNLPENYKKRGNTVVKKYIEWSVAC